MKVKYLVMAGIIFLVLFLVISLLPLLTILTMSYDTAADIQREFGVIIIPGQGARNGSLVISDSGDITQRLDFALEIFERQEQKPLLILSGYGKGYVARVAEDIEATVMYNVIAPQLRQAGYFPEDYIILENQSHHTLENALYSKKLIPPDVNAILILAPSKSYTRSNLIFKSILAQEEVIVYTIKEQPVIQKKAEFLRNTGTILMLLVPTDQGRLWVGKYLYLFFFQKGCFIYPDFLYARLCELPSH